MPKKPRNRFIDLGLLAFIALLLSYGFAFVSADMGNPSGWGILASTILGYLILVLPFVSFGLCLYGWYKFNPNKEKETGATTVLIISGLLIMIFLYQVYERIF